MNVTLMADLTGGGTPTARTLPVQKIKQISRPTMVQETYVTPYVSDCKQYTDQLIQKDAEIAALKSELSVYQNKAQQKLQKELKTSYDTALEKFDSEPSSIKTTNSVTISEDPSK